MPGHAVASRRRWAEPYRRGSELGRSDWPGESPLTASGTGVLEVHATLSELAGGSSWVYRWYTCTFLYPRVPAEVAISPPSSSSASAAS